MLNQVVSKSLTRPDRTHPARRQIGKQGIEAEKTEQHAVPVHGVGCGQPAAALEFALVRPVDLPQQPRACPLSQETQSEHARMQLAHGVGPCRVPREIEARAGRLRETPGCEELGFDIHFAQCGDRFERWH